MKLETLPITKLKPAPYNPRVALKLGDPVFERLRQSIDSFGVVEPVVWNRTTGYVVGGHQRLSVLKTLGHKTVDVVVVELTPAREKSLNLALNKIHGEWDNNKLAALLEELSRVPDLELGLTGFESDEVDRLLRSIPGMGGPLGDDADFDVNAALDDKGPVVTQPGELLVLGRHRLLCGDSTKPEDVRRVMNGQRAVLFATDPPYLVGYDGSNHPTKSSKRSKRNSRLQRRSVGQSSSPASATQQESINWDDPDANPELYDRFIGVAVAEAIAANAAWYCWHASRNQAMVESAWTKHGAFVHQQIIWTKNRPVLSRSWYSWQHEPCFMGWVSGKKPPRAEKAVLSSVWPIDTLAKGPDRPDHPTPKPLEVFEIPMRQHTLAGDICYEPFAGSGSQLIAAERLGRVCHAIELSPRYCDVIVRRWIHSVGAAHAPRALVARYMTSPTGAKPATVTPKSKPRVRKEVAA